MFLESRAIFSPSTMPSRDSGPQFSSRSRSPVTAIIDPLAASVGWVLDMAYGLLGSSCTLQISTLSEQTHRRYSARDLLSSPVLLPRLGQIPWTERVSEECVDQVGGLTTSSEHSKKTPLPTTGGRYFENIPTRSPSNPSATTGSLSALQRKKCTLISMLGWAQNRAA